ncbi:hypothetical protein H6P81_016750 [Aristolochia fimbriata]|uniref:S-adenosyl-L-methionine-dependent methyltransferase n=1 Tax=Aristolochia fimbriata TaxID=158543 RepID=A0AAV7E955_ARIFI|nr:hypothetical protein H6P81_016750 [Aristolochia fimbriata]
MAWSAESATKAYLQTLKMGKRWGKEPDMSEFVSALAAGNGARLMVVACGGAAGATTLALAAAAQETGGRVVCILPGLRELRQSKALLAAAAADLVEFVVGDASTLLLSDYQGADFVLIDCDLDDHEEILEAAQVGRKRDGVVVVGYNAFHGGKWQKSMLLPIGDGLQVVTIKPPARKTIKPPTRRSRWVVRVDACTGEEHVYRITNPHMRELEA